MGSHWEKVVVDAGDPARLARWWAAALGYRITQEAPGAVEIRRGSRDLPALVFVLVTVPKTARNRLRIDLRPDDRDAEVERLLDMGARHVDGGTGPDGGPGAVVLADPEGNEFRVLAPG